MPSFVPINISSLEQTIAGADSKLPPNVAGAINAQLGQVGNSTIIKKLQDIASGAGVNGVVFQQSAFPIRKYVSFYITDGTGTKPLELVSDDVKLGYKPGYFFNMHVNPSNMGVTIPKKLLQKPERLGDGIYNIGIQKPEH